MKKAKKKLLKRMRLSPEQVADIAQRFVRAQCMQYLPLDGPVEPDARRPNTWVVRFKDVGPDGQRKRMDPDIVIVLVDDVSEEASFFLVL